MKWNRIYISKCKCGSITAAHLDMKDKSTREWVGELIEQGRPVEVVEAENVTLSECKCGGGK